MAEDISYLIMEQLRLIRADIAGLRDEFKEARNRLANLETNVVGLRRDIANLYAEISGQHARYDTFADRIERIEKRLGLINGETP